jgi:hypothetical protein
MTEEQIKEQIETIRQATREAIANPEVARRFLDDPLIFPPQKKSPKKKKARIATLPTL